MDNYLSVLVYIVYYTCISPVGEYHDCKFGAKSLEVGLNMLNHLVAEGWKLSRIHLAEGSSLTLLPVEAFDGQPVERALALLQLEWQAALSSF